MPSNVLLKVSLKIFSFCNNTISSTKSEFDFFTLYLKNLFIVEYLEDLYVNLLVIISSFYIFFLQITSFYICCLFNKQGKKLKQMLVLSMEIMKSHITSSMLPMYICKNKIGVEIMKQKYGVFILARVSMYLHFKHATGVQRLGFMHLSIKNLETYAMFQVL